MSTIFRDRVTAQRRLSAEGEEEVLATAVEFNNWSLRPAGSIDWWIDGMDGWDKSAELEVRSNTRSGQTDGEVAAAYFPARARHMLVTGWVQAETRAAAESCSDIIVRDAFPTNDYIKLVRYEAVPKYLWVRVSGPHEILRVSQEAFRWVVPVMAEQPFKLSNSALDNESGSSGVAGLSSGGRTYDRVYPLEYSVTSEGDDNSVVLFNHGTAPTYPVITIVGPLPTGGWRITNDTYGDSLTFDVGLTLTDTLTIDFEEQIALLNGYPITATITGDFWTVRPGANVIKLFSTFDPDAGFSAEIRSAWR